MESNGESLQAFQQALLNPLTAVWNQLVGLLPNLMAAIVLIALGYGLAKSLAFFAVKLLGRLGIDRLSRSTGLDEAAAGAGLQLSLSNVLGQILFWLVMFTALLAAANALGLPELSETVKEVVLYIPKVLGAVFVILMGLFAAHAVRKTVQATGSRSGIVYSNGLANFLYGVLLIVTLSLALGQLDLEVGLLNQLVAIVALTIGIAIALSLGLGTRDIAANIVAGYYAREIHEPGSHIAVGDFEGELISINTTKTLIKTESDTTVAIANRDLLNGTTRSRQS